jgi:hypothetical protein
MKRARIIMAGVGLAGLAAVGGTARQTSCPGS